MSRTQTHQRIRIRRLKRVLVLISALMVATTLLLTSCNNRRWNDKQRKATREMIEQWRQLAYLNALTEEEFALFAGRVTDVLEEEYPSYVEFVEMPMVGDSVEMVIVATIVTDIKASPTRLGHIFPYEELVANNILPEGLDQATVAPFYVCMAEKVNTLYGTMLEFVQDIIYSRLDDMIVARMISQCAQPYWDVEMEVIDIR